MTDPAPRLYPRGTRLADVPPDFRGVPLRQWLEDCREAERQRAARWFAQHYPDGPPLSRQRIYSPRDGYGMKSA